MSRSTLVRAAAAGTLTVSLVLAGTGVGSHAAPLGTGLVVTPLGVYDGGGETAAEIVTFDPASKRMFVTNGETNSIDIVDMINPSSPSFIRSVSMAPYGGGLQSVAVAKGKVAVAVKAADPTAVGTVVVLDVDGGLLAQYPVGVLPDSLTFTPNGRYIVVANEAEPVCDGASLVSDPEGSVSIIDLKRNTSRTAGFGAWNGREQSLRDRGIRIFFPGSSVAQDLEPEYVSIDSSGSWAYVTLQENNAIAVVDIGRARVTRLMPLGYKDHSKIGNGIDPTDDDGVPGIERVDVLGMYMPDTIATADLRGSKYLVTANEGDSRDYDCYSEEDRVRDYTLGASYAPGSTDDDELGRLKTTSAFPTVVQPGNVLDQVYSYGSRSFTIWDLKGRVVFDSGDEFERYTSTLGSLYNNDDGDIDERSDDKGPEPEALAIGKAFGRTYAFVGLERTGGFFVYDISAPRAARLVTYVEGGSDVSPEGMTFVPAAKSPNGKPLLLVAHEISGTTRAYQLDFVS